MEQVKPSTAHRTPPTGLYIHIPFCVRRCPYCDFYVLPLGDGPPGKRLREFRSLKHRGFLNALDAELADLPDGFQPRTVYLGGGTPTELPPEDLARVFASLTRHVDLSHVDEFTCEANPGTLDREMADLLVSNGADRISLGVQSFSDANLEFLGRIHSAEEAAAAVTLLRDAGCTNLSVDLLFGLPEIHPADVATSLNAIRDLQPDHVSWYSLEYEPGTAFTEMRDQGRITLPEEEATAAEYQQIREGLLGLGYAQYELFSFTRPGKECRHNLNYWQGGEYLGCGPSAHSHHQGTRWRNPPDLTGYLSRDQRPEQAETLPPEQKARELFMTRLRLTEGVNAREFHAQSGFSIDRLLGDALERWTRIGWLQVDGDRVRLTPEAYLISDHLFREIV